MLAERGKIALAAPTRRWLEEALSQPGFRLAPLDASIAADACALPDGFRSDPADHIIVATSRVLEAILVTHDRTIRAYSERGNLEVLGF